MYFHSTFSRQKLLVFSFHEGIFSCSRQELLLLLGFFFYFCGHTIWHTSIIESIQDVEHIFCQTFAGRSCYTTQVYHY